MPGSPTTTSAPNASRHSMMRCPPVRALTCRDTGLHYSHGATTKCRDDRRRHLSPRPPWHQQPLDAHAEPRPICLECRGVRPASDLLIPYHAGPRRFPHRHVLLHLHGLGTVARAARYAASHVVARRLPDDGRRGHALLHSRRLWLRPRLRRLHLDPWSGR